MHAGSCTDVYSLHTWHQGLRKQGVRVSFWHPGPRKIPIFFFWGGGGLGGRHLSFGQNFLKTSITYRYSKKFNS